jgi:hypothetical protein
MVMNELTASFVYRKQLDNPQSQQGAVGVGRPDRNYTLSSPFNGTKFLPVAPEQPHKSRFQAKILFCACPP